MNATAQLKTATSLFGDHNVDASNSDPCFVMSQM
jgi:hypothetical protein